MTGAFQTLGFGPSWADHVTYAQAMTHPTITLTTPRHPTLQAWRLSIVTDTGQLAGFILTDPLRLLDPVTTAECDKHDHAAPAAQCWCGLRGVTRINDSLAWWASKFTSRQRGYPPILHKVTLIDAYDSHTPTMNTLEWHQLQVRVLGFAGIAGDGPDTYRARQMRIDGPGWLPATVDPDLARKVSTRYGIPLTIVPDVDTAIGLVEWMANRTGATLTAAAYGPSHAEVAMGVCPCGEHHHGQYGAAGVAAVAERRILLQRRSANVQEPGTWALPGGALRPGETPTQGAIREYSEETDFGDVEPRFKIVGTHTWMCPESGWTYSTVLASFKGDGRPAVKPATRESDYVRWVPIGDVEQYRLHPVFAQAWPTLKRRLAGESTAPNGAVDPAPFRVAIVCHGNIIRSVMAEHILTRLLPDAATTSGGINPDVGYSADPLTIDTLQRHGYDATSHRARQVTPGWFDTHDLIFAVDTFVANALRRLAPDTAAHAKVRYLREFDPTARSLDVVNPWRGGPEQFEQCYAVVEAACRGVAAYVEANTP